MTSIRSIGAATAWLLMAAAQCCQASPTQDTSSPSPSLAQPRPLDVIADDDDLVVAINEPHGIPVEDFIKLGQMITGKTFTYSKADVGPDHRISFVGSKRVKKENFFSFFQTILYLHGLATVIHGEGDAEVIEIIRLTGSCTR